MACNSGNEIAVALLIQNGADLNAQTCGGETPLMKAAANGYLNIVKALLTNNADPMIKAKNGLTALNYAQMF